VRKKRPNPPRPDKLAGLIKYKKATGKLEDRPLGRLRRENKTYERLHKSSA